MRRLPIRTTAGRFAALALLALAGPAGITGPAGAQTTGTWTPAEPMLLPRRLLAAASEGGRIYTFGGCGSPCFQPPFHTSTLEETRIEVFDPAAGSWSVRGPIPAIVFGAAAAAPGNGRIYLVGGYLTSNATLEYDPAADSWTVKAPMPTSRYGLAAVALGGKVYAVGGGSGAGPSRALEVYDPATDTWTARAPLPTGRVFLAAAAAGGRLYAIGGSPDCCGGSKTAAVEVYDPAADAWSAAAPLPVARQGSAAAAAGGKVYSLGGFIPGQGVDGRTFEYDPATDRWRELAPLPDALARDQAPAVAIGSRIHLLGGSVDCHCQARDDVDVFDPNPTPDLAITKESTLAGDALEYTITVENVGTVAVAGAVVRDPFPAQLQDVFWTCAASAGASCEPGAGDLDREIDLDPGASVVFTVAATVRSGTCGEIRNVSEVILPSGLVDADPSDNRAVVRDVVPVVDAHFTISKSNGVDRVACGETVTYEIAVANGGGDAVAARVVDPFPDALEGASWTCSASSPGASCTAGPVAGDLDDVVHLPAGGSVAYTVTATVGDDAAGSLVNAASVTCLDACCDTTASATDSDPIDGCFADLAIAKTAEPAAVTAGDAATFLLAVTNRGPNRVEGARVTDELPAALASASWSCQPEAACTPSAGAGDLVSEVDLDPGTVATFTLTGPVRADYVCPFVNTARVHSPLGSPDPFAADNVATAAVTVLPAAPGVAGCKTVSGDFVDGSVVTYTLILLNPGPFPQGDNPGPELVDDLPLGLTLIDAHADRGEIDTVADNVLWNGEIPVGGTVTITIRARIDEGQEGRTLCNRTKIFTDPDGDGDNDVVVVSDDPKPPGSGDATCFTVVGPLAVPTLSSWGLALLALSLLAAGLARGRGDGRSSYVRR